MTPKDTPRPADLFIQAVNNLQEALAYEKSTGNVRVEADPAALAELSQPVTFKRASSAHTAAPAMPKKDSLIKIAAEVDACTGCPLHASRTNTVPGRGSSNPELIFIGEGPGANEDAQGLPFVGRSGQLLSKMIAAMGFDEEQVWIGNIVKCRPPDNRTPSPDEMDACMPYLKRQLSLLKPSVIVCLGATAVKGLLDTREGITKIRGTWMTFEGIDVMPTYHPAYLLRNPPAKKDVWEDLKDVVRHMGRKLPPQNRDK